MTRRQQQMVATVVITALVFSGGLAVGVALRDWTGRDSPPPLAASTVARASRGAHCIAEGFEQSDVWVWPAAANGDCRIIDAQKSGWWETIP